MRLGAVIGGPLQTLGAVGSRVEELGFDSVWTAETGSSAFISSAVLAQSTSRVQIGTAIALAFPRSPAITAMTALDLDELSQGRFILGLGSQVKRVNEQRFSTPFEHPAPKMTEYVQAMRAFIGGFYGETPAFEGRFYNITLAPWPRIPPPIRRDVPVYFAAVNKMMLRAAGQVAHGVVGHPMTSPSYIEQVVLPNIAKGAARAGRQPSEVTLSQQVMVAISEDAEQAKREAKQQIGFYATTRTYTPVLALHGFEEVVPKLRDAYGRKDLGKLTSLVSDEMVDTFALYGTAEEVKEKAKRFEGLADELVLGGPWYEVDPVRLAENYQAMLTAFAR